MMDWTDEQVQKFVQDAFVYGSHNALCLAHGRQTLLPVSLNLFHSKFLSLFAFWNLSFALLQYAQSEYPKFKLKEEPITNLKCAMNSPQEASKGACSNFKLASIFLLILLLLPVLL